MISLQVMITIFCTTFSICLFGNEVSKNVIPKKQWVLCVMSILLTIGSSCVIYQTTEDICAFTRFITLYQILFCIAVIDYRHKMIPNFLLLVGMGCQLVCNFFYTFYTKFFMDANFSA